MPKIHGRKTQVSRLSFICTQSRQVLQKEFWILQIANDSLYNLKSKML